MIYLMRHGETDWNAVRRIQGHTDIPLNARGIQAMEAAGQRLRDLGFRVDCMASSPLKRAAETARIIGTQIGYDGEILCEPDLIERSFGKAEGVSLLDHPDLTDETYGVEKMEDLRQRVERLVEDPLAAAVLTGETSGQVCLTARAGQVELLWREPAAV